MHAWADEPACVWRAQLNETIPTLLRGAADVGATGIMVDVWWGLCERQPNEYNFDGYLDLMQQCKQLGLKVQAVMSFHACGGNVGDSVNVPLPQWVLDLQDSVPELFYRDKRGDASTEYVSLSCDFRPVFPCGPTAAAAPETGGPSKRTAVEVYTELMAAFRDASKDLIADGTLEEIQVGCGPCGELRYPSYPLTPREHFPAGWQWPGLGEVQCYDAGMLAALKASLARDAPPSNMGSYNDFPEDVSFWREPPARRRPRIPEGWCGLGGHTTPVGRMLRHLHKTVTRKQTPPVPEASRVAGEEEETYHQGSGEAFLAWYRDQLVAHGAAVTSAAREVFGPDMRLACKVSGIHWLRGHDSQVPWPCAHARSPAPTRSPAPARSPALVQGPTGRSLLDSPPSPWLLLRMPMTERMF